MLEKGLKNEELGTWKPHRPRFVVETCERCSDDRMFKNGKVVYNQNLGLAYSVDELVEVLNCNYFSDYLFELLQVKIWYCQAMYNSTNDEKYKLEEECLKQLRDECHSYHSIYKYNAFLESYLKKDSKKE